MFIVAAQRYFTDQTITIKRICFIWRLTQCGKRHRDLRNVRGAIKREYFSEISSKDRTLENSRVKTKDQSAKCQRKRMQKKDAISKLE